MQKKASMASLASVVLLASSISLTGCGTGKETAADSKGSKDKVTIRIASINRDETRKAFLDMIKEKFPNITIDYNFIDNNTFTDVVTTQLASGGGPDIIEGYDIKWVKNGYLLDLTGKEFITKFTDNGLKPTNYEGKIYGIPTTGWFEGVFYNKDIFDKNGLKPPKTFDEWLAIHEKLKQNGVKPQAMGAQSWEPMMKQSMSMAFNEFYSKPENKNFDQDVQTGKRKISEWSDAFKIWDEMVQKKYLTQDMLGISYDQALDEFASGKAAMWESGPWSYVAMMKKNPNLKLDMFPLPGKTSATGYLVGGPGNPWSVNANGKHKDEVLQILNLMATPEAQKALMKSYFGPSFLKGLDNPELPAQYTSVKDAFVQGRVYAPWPYWGPIGGSNFITELGKLLQDHLAGDKTIDQVLQKADKIAADMIQQAK
ncbi:ABC transporter substrate-binding protein [Paenibacillus alginolyticus]|uniref:Extracellular solute-binding protein n=1 Tax=Paenibacillus alginolyticus TaxID=59839 RepID=A0ABT4GIT6_9BACL|nr:extracellular solute-binding protein [Paenibacillus alginolyticus]MCY9696101.1 extracellular solute-binding protein [Paenibacillus alginolyticus]MEC0143382.1 extracellular solute-binding protein [Paenibacillus alginolyticus]